MSTAHNDDDRSAIPAVAIAVIVAILLAAVLVLLVVFVGTPDLYNDAVTPQFSTFTASGVPWPETRYQASFENGKWSGSSGWTPAAPEMTSPAEFNINPLLFVSNAQYHQVVQFRRQTKQGNNTNKSNKQEADQWFPVELHRTGPWTFVDTQRPDDHAGPPLAAPEFERFAVPRPQWCATWYSVSLATVANWSAWSARVSSATESFPVISVADPLGGASGGLASPASPANGPAGGSGSAGGSSGSSFVFRRTLDPIKDPAGQVARLDLVPIETFSDRLSFIDRNLPCAVVVVTNSNKRFYVAVDENHSDNNSDHGYVFHFDIAPGQYQLPNLLALVAQALSDKFGLATVEVGQLGKVQVHLAVPQPGADTYSGLTYRVRTATAAGSVSDCLSPNSNDVP